MLITGESGAGKTENTKKVITYFAILGSGGDGGKKKKDDPEAEKKANLEDRIVNTNPILESYGNAKTIRNDNSSRFGKFIRIYFNQMGKLAGGFIDVYLLEKSRVTYQQPNERGYHIFFQLVEEGPIEGLQEMCCFTTDPYDFFFMSQGKVKVDSIDDNEELEFTDAAFDTLGFDLQEKQSAFKLTACICHFGEMTFKQKGREESCEMDDPLPGQKASQLLGVENWQLFYGNFIRPKIKVGTEWVYKGQNADNCLNSVAALARSMYNRLFMWLVDLCNRTLIDPTMKKVNFIGVLDIAGFKFLNSIPSNRYVSISVTKNCSNSSIITCLFLSKKSMSVRALSGKWLTLEWILKQQYSSWRNQWVYWLFLKRKHCSPKLLINLLMIN